MSEGKKKCSKPGCKCYALKNDPQGLCFWHSPQTAEARRQAGRKGGRRGKVELADVAVESISDIKVILTETLNELRTTKTESVTSKSRAVGYLCGVMIMALEKSELESRIAALEREIFKKSDDGLLDFSAGKQSNGVEI